MPPGRAASAARRPRAAVAGGRENARSKACRSSRLSNRRATGRSAHRRSSSRSRIAGFLRTSRPAGGPRAVNSSLKREIDRFLPDHRNGLSRQAIAPMAFPRQEVEQARGRRPPARPMPSTATRLAQGRTYWKPACSSCMMRATPAGTTVACFASTGICPSLRAMAFMVWWQASNSMPSRSSDSSRERTGEFWRSIFKPGPKAT